MGELPRQLLHQVQNDFIDPVASIDKRGTLRYIGRDMDFEDDESAGRLIHELIEE